MGKGLITFKFKCESEFDSVTFDGQSINVKELKKRIANLRKITQSADQELIMIDFQTQKELNDEMLPTNYQVIVQRKITGKLNPILIDQNNKEITNNTLKKQLLQVDDKVCNLCFNQTLNETITGCCAKLVCRLCLHNSLIQSNGMCLICKKIAQKPYMTLDQYKQKQNEELMNLIKQQNFQESQLIELRQKQINQIQPENNNINNIQSSTQQKQLMQIKELQEQTIENANRIEQYDIKQEQDKSMEILESYLTDAKYFIIKSNNEENLKVAQDQNKWATTVNNQKKLQDAFFEKSNVILIFSVNKSAKFQGFARMDSNLSEYNNHLWRDQSTIKIGQDFKIKWLKIHDLSFNKVGHYPNPANNNDPIKKSRDGTELTEQLGYMICNMFEGQLLVKSYNPTKKDYPDLQQQQQQQQIQQQYNLMHFNPLFYQGIQQKQQQKEEGGSRKNSGDIINNNHNIKYMPSLNAIGQGFPSLNTISNEYQSNNMFLFNQILFNNQIKQQSQLQSQLEINAVKPTVLKQEDEINNANHNINSISNKYKCKDDQKSSVSQISQREKKREKKEKEKSKKKRQSKSKSRSRNKDRQNNKNKKRNH